MIQVIQAILFTVLLLISHLTLEASDLRVIQVDTDVYNIKLSEKKRISEKNDRFKFHFNIHEKTTNKEFTFEMENLTTDVKKFSPYKEKFIIFGSIGSNVADVITIVDLKLNKEIDS